MGFVSYGQFFNAFGEKKRKRFSARLYFYAAGVL
jgi:hypothetical protein